LLLFLEEQQETSIHLILNPTNNYYSVTRRVDLLEDLLTASQQRLYMRKWRDALKELATLAIDADLTSHT
jgi:hypothetical protein